MWRKRSGTEFEVSVGSPPPPDPDTIDPAKRLRIEGAEEAGPSGSVPISPCLGPHSPTNTHVSTPRMMLSQSHVKIIF